MALGIGDGPNERYDRQLMIWGNTGQEVLLRAHVCVVESEQTLLMQECIKSLVLMGVGEITVVSNSCGSSQAGLFGLDALQRMNPNVNFHLKEMSSLPPDAQPQHAFWQSFSIIICLCTAGPMLQHVLGLSASNVIHAYTFDDLGFIRLLGKEPHCVVNSHQHTTYDLRLNRMWDELAQYHRSFDLNHMSHEQVSSVPYSVLLFNVRQSLQLKGIPINRKTVKAELSQLHNSLLTGPLSDDVNFAEAERFAFLLCKPTGEFPPNLTKIITTFESEPVSTVNRWVYQFALSVRSFFELNGDIPVSKAIPDMESSTSLFIAQKAIYHRKADKDKSEILKILADKKFHLIPEHLMDIMLENLSCLDVILLGYKNSLPELHSGNPKYEELLSRQSNGNSSKLSSPSIISIIGAIISQECVKLLTHQYAPIENSMIYDGASNSTSTFIL
ncbi:unnamed protein product [Kluyveromyces dobzhanskii CBS 2104]|uniref:WGS project CCBQ000000000 data, contig 00012 n=1 Tax=Kluyveromyces dobzhanskii CBS 2104 TaxID=1427455 RepID=A0A0A8L3G0_9SACH|nr:unnamed protein product [Kluyveromyces dobzhanskii CBS 2104]